jgi:hypothetical protein
MGGLILPIVLPGPIEKWGTERTMRGLSVAVLVILGPILPLIRGRLPEDRIGECATKPDQEQSRSWLRSPTLWSLMAMNTVQGLAYYLPSIWLPSKRSSLDKSRKTTLTSLHTSLRHLHQSFTVTFHSSRGSSQRRRRLGSYRSGPLCRLVRRLAACSVHSGALLRFSPRPLGRSIAYGRHPHRVWDCVWSCRRQLVQPLGRASAPHFTGRPCAIDKSLRLASYHDRYRGRAVDSDRDITREGRTIGRGTFDACPLWVCGGWRTLRRDDSICGRVLCGCSSHGIGGMVYAEERAQAGDALRRARKSSIYPFVSLDLRSRVLFVFCCCYIGS